MYKVYCKDLECIPYKKHRTDAGIDLKSSQDITVYTKVPAKVHTGIHVEIPEGYVGLIFPRSGLSTKHGVRLANTIGVIDSDYRGEIICAMISDQYHYNIQKGERIAQLVVIPCMLDWMVTNRMEDLSDTERGEGGFGSTGKY